MGIDVARVPLRCTRSSAARSRASAARASACRSRRSGSTGLTGGAGWIAIALVIFAFWRADLCLVGRLPLRRLLGAAVHAAGARLPPDVPAEVFQALPYVMTVVVLVIVSYRLREAPARRAGRARHAVRARGAVEQRVDVLTPRSLDEALRLKAELPGGALRPGRHRRARRAQLRPLAAAGADQPQRGRRSCAAGRARTARCRLGAGLTYTEAMRGAARRAAAGAGRGVAHGRLAADPQPRARSAATSAPPRRPATRCRRSLVEDAEVELASVRGGAAAAAHGVPASA